MTALSFELDKGLSLKIKVFNNFKSVNVSRSFYIFKNLFFKGFKH